MRLWPLPEALRLAQNVESSSLFWNWFPSPVSRADVGKAMNKCNY
jgi:hypothetical protein